MAEDMEQAMKDIRSGYEAYNRGDFDAVAQFLHPDITWNRVADVEQPLHGREAARANMEPVAFEAQESELLEIEASGDWVVCRAVFRGRGAGSGIEVTDEAFHAWRIRDGLAVEFHYFPTREEALAATGS